MKTRAKYPCIFICIPVHNRIEYSLKCIESIKAQQYTNYKIIICDDGSSDNTSKIISENHSDVVIIKGAGNLWWTGGTNECVKLALEYADDEDYVYTLNNDTELLSDTLTKLIEISSQNKGSIIGTLNLFYDNPNLIENSAFKRNVLFGYSRLHKFGQFNNEIDKLRVVDALSGKGVLIPIKTFKEIGLYNSKMLPHYHADFEFTYRAKKTGHPLYLSTSARLLSHQYLSGTGSVTSKVNFKEFILSFNNIKSTHHLPSLINFHKLIYGKTYPFYLFLSLLFIHLGFAKRYFRRDKVL